MIVQAIKNLEIQRVGDTEEGIQAGIDESSLPFVFELVSKQLYSNPIGSIIREITSNCFDSHIEAGVEDPVIISKTHNHEEGYSIEFKDVGVGLSPDRVRSVFMNYFSSTKRADNTQIGGFGIGSKTPLAYADLFYIITVYDKIEYIYILHKGESKPTLELLNEEETEAHNGTTIKININDTSTNRYEGDLGKFKQELIFQLAYFDNVYFKDWGITNDYDIYEGERFKFRSDIPQRDTDIHVCIGKVRYPIDFDKVDVPNKYRQIPVAVKFEIGELQVTPSRETLRYDDKGIALIQERVKLAVEEIMSIFEKQNPIIEDLETYEKVKKETPRITFDRDKNHILNMWSASGLSKNFVFKPLMELNIKKIPDNLFFMWTCIGHLQGDIFRSFDIDKYNSKIDNSFILNSKYVIIGKDDKLSSYTNTYINETNNLYHSSIYFIKRKELDYNEITKILGIKETKTLGKAKTIIQYLKIINNIVYSKGQFYKDLRPTDEWIAEYKRSIIESTAAYIRKKNQKVFVRDIGRNSKGIELSVLALEKRTGILVYGFREDKEILGRIYETIVSNKASIKGLRYDRRNKAFMVIQISKSVEKDIIGPRKTIYWKKIFETRFFKRIVTHKEIFNRLQDLQLSALSYRKQFLRGFQEDYNTIKNSIKDYSSTSSDFYFRNTDFNQKTCIIEDLLKPIEEFKKKHTYDVPLIGALHNVYDNDIQEVADYLKYKGFKLRNEFYLKDQRQLEYEAALKQILKTFKCPQNNLLTYNLINNGNENIISSKEDREEYSDNDRQEEIQQNSDEGGDRYDYEEGRDV